jgi:hypothetical protein
MRWEREFVENGSDEMLLGEAFQQFVQRSPVAVLVNGIMERVFDPDKLEELFQKHAVGLNRFAVGRPFVSLAQ